MDFRVGFFEKPLVWVFLGENPSLYVLLSLLFRVLAAFIPTASN